MSRTIYTLARFAMCGLFLFSLVNTAHAQFRAGVQGTVSDSAGALVPGASVVLRDTETGKTQEQIVEELAQNGVLAVGFGTQIRMVTHLDATAGDIDKTTLVMRQLCT